MNIYDIKRKANELLVNHDKLFKVLLYIGIIQAIFSAVSTLFDGVVGGIVSLIITILTLTLSHGAIVASLKTVNNMEESIDEKEDALVGLKKIGHLFPTYFLYISAIFTTVLYSYSKSWMVMVSYGRFSFNFRSICSYKANASFHLPESIYEIAILYSAL